jgi:DNA-binding MarR family transcriptional regulator
MALLWEDGTLSVGRIGARLRLDSSTLSPLLKRLEALGLVARRRSAVDERSVDIELTSDGSSLREAARGIPELVCRSTGLQDVELRSLVSELRTLAEHLESDAG